MRVSRTVSACLILALSAAVPKAAADVLPPENIVFISTSDSSTAAKAGTKEPSTLQKLSSGTKKFFSDVGNTLTGKKKTTKKPISPYASAMKSSSAAKQSQQKKSWLGSLFSSEKPKKQPQMTPTDWIGQQRMDW